MFPEAYVLLFPTDVVLLSDFGITGSRNYQTRKTSKVLRSTSPFGPDLRTFVLPYYTVKVILVIAWRLVEY